MWAWFLGAFTTLLSSSVTRFICWMEIYLLMFGNVMVIFAGLTAAFMIFRRGD